MNWLLKSFHTFKQFLQILPWSEVNLRDEILCQITLVFLNTITGSIRDGMQVSLLIAKNLQQESKRDEG